MSNIIDPTLDYQVITGDCLQILPQLAAGSVDAVVTDPPYGIGRDGSLATTGRHGGRKAYEFKGWDTERPSRECVEHLRRVSKTQVIWGGNYLADLLPPTQRWLVWDKGQRIAQSDGELAWTSEEGALRIFTQNRVALMMDGAVHPTQKPVSLMLWCVENFTLAGSLVLDPFCGSGTTGVACRKLGRRFIGIEISETYAAIARRRIADAGFPLFGT